MNYAVNISLCWSAMHCKYKCPNLKIDSIFIFKKIYFVLLGNIIRIYVILFNLNYLFQIFGLFWCEIKERSQHCDTMSICLHLTVRKNSNHPVF